MTLKTRRPTGKPSWPILLIAGVEKAGKSYSAAALSASTLIDRTLWIEVGEGSADQYGAMPGARYEIVEHDGTYKSMLQAARDAVAEPSNPKRPNVIVVDSGTELWDLLCAEQQAVADKRNKDTITVDQWNVAKKRWRQFFDALRAHNGPVIITARFEQVTVMEKGKPTERKEWKVRAEKNLPFEVDGVIQIPKARMFYLSGMRSLTMSVPMGGWLELPDFTFDKFLRDLGIAENIGDRTYVAPTVDHNDAEMTRPATERVTADDLGDEPPEHDLFGAA